MFSLSKTVQIEITYETSKPIIRPIVTPIEIIVPSQDKSLNVNKLKLTPNNPQINIGTKKRCKAEKCLIFKLHCLSILRTRIALFCHGAAARNRCRDNEG